MAARLVREPIVPEYMLDEPEQVPPHDIDAEAAVIAAVLLDPTALPRLADFLEPIHFFQQSNRNLFEAALAVRATGAAVDAQTVASRLRETGKLAVGGVGAIVAMLDATPAPRNVRDHATTVFERWRARTALLIGQRIAAEGYAGVPDVQAYVDRCARAYNELARRRAGVVVESNLDTLKRVIREIAATMSGESSAPLTRGMRTGLTMLDEATLGLHGGQKTTVIALPRVGKTAFGLQVAMNIARRGIGVLFFSTEMTREELVERQISNLASIDGKRIKQSRQRSVLDKHEYAAMLDGLGQLKGIHYVMDIHDDANIRPEDIAHITRQAAETFMSSHGVPLGLVVVDYVQKLRPSRQFERRNGASRYEIVTHATGVLKSIAMEHQVAVLELAQQKNFELDKRTGKRARPSLGSAADSAQIERDADNVLYLYRPNERDGKHVTAYLAKQRSGEETEFDLDFHAQYSRFTDAGLWDDSRRAGT